MKANNFISKKEFKVLLTIAFVTSLLAFSNLTSQAIEKYNNFVLEQQTELRNQSNNEPTFKFYSFERASFLPSLNFLLLFIFPAFYKSKKFIISTVLTLLIFVPFTYELYRGFRIILFYNPFPERDFSELIFLVANHFDYLIFSFVSILLFWQISILLRMLIKTLQKERALP